MVKTIKVSVDHDVRVFGYHRQYISRISFSQNSFLSSTEAPESVSEEITRLVNTFAKKIKATSCGYEAVMSENAALAVWHVINHRRTSSEELDKIAKTGFSKYQKFVQQLGLKTLTSPSDVIKKGFKQIIVNGDRSLDISEFPYLLLCLRNSPETTCLWFKEEDVDVTLLKKVLNCDRREREYQMFKGTSLFSTRNTQRKYVRLASSGGLTLDKLGKGLLRSGLRTYEKWRMERIMGWFKRNNLKKYLTELIIKKMLVSGGKHPG